MSRKPLTVEIAAGELIDKISILEIKAERLTDAAKVKNVGRELETLRTARQQAFQPTPDLDDLCAALKTVNERLWQIEDDIRACETAKDFGPSFVDLARAVYVNNDERAALKRRINDLLGSRIVEEKSYTAY